VANVAITGGARGIGLEQVPYGVSKYGSRYVTKALVKSVANTPVNVGFLSPGIVTTEMAVPRAENRDEFFDANRNFLNNLADHVETVTAWAVERMLVARKNGTVIRWMGPGRAAGRFATSLFRKRRVIEEAMQRLDTSNGEAPHDREYEYE
jgi:NAD(P)-dependent dehydrogenase (short-subunit alcohol dehydrogenase family)